jgi:hypothetical protein
LQGFLSAVRMACVRDGEAHSTSSTEIQEKSGDLVPYAAISSIDLTPSIVESTPRDGGLVS